MIHTAFVASWQDWEVRYHRDTPLTPRQDVNAPDLYIPSKLNIKRQLCNTAVVQDTGHWILV